MPELLTRVVEANGGLARWKKRHETLSTAIVTGSALWALKGLVQDVSRKGWRQPGRCHPYNAGYSPGEHELRRWKAGL
ncbi:hypothetical protein [Dickeya chrysanthemi]|uniref:Transposase n=1 Tax=Dickeya chrysanthemi TaxID=556 RepID=A0ABU8JIR6_DICCH|nr:hypothetical protein [Dickeya chrysanthemi]MBX9445797.1 hypothetical protein [Dickeya chrysanthemi]MCA7006373.1 hypothetical protein [Dickeya chrysanthemi]